MNVTWTVYQGTLNVTSNTTQWTPYAPMSQYEDVWFFGESSTSSSSFVRRVMSRLELQQLHRHE